MAFEYGQRKADGQYEHHPTEVKDVYVAPLRDKYIHLTCGGVTKMCGDGLIKTYATNPTFYGATFCVVCHNYFSLIIDGVRQFLWTADKTPVGETHGTPGEDLRGLG